MTKNICILHNEYFSWNKILTDDSAVLMIRYIRVVGVWLFPFLQWSVTLHGKKEIIHSQHVTPDYGKYDKQVP